MNESKVLLKDWLTVFDLAKQLKSDMVLITPDVLIGFDSTISILRTIELPYMESSLPTCIFVVKDIKNMIGMAPFTEFVTITPDNTLEFSAVNLREQLKLNFDPFLIEMVYNSYKYILFEIERSSKTYIKLNDMETDRQVIKFNSLSASSGSMIYLHTKFAMVWSYGLFSMNKSDKLTLTFFDRTDYFIARFQVLKKNKLCITTYVKCLYL